MTPLRIAIFLSVVVLILGGSHYYVWARLVRDTELPAPWSTVATGVLAALGAAMIGGLLLTRLGPRSVASPVLWVTYSWMGFAFFVLFLFGAVDLVRWLLSLASAAGIEQARMDPDRRQFVARVLGATITFAAFALGSSGLVAALRPAAVKRVRVALGRLPRGLDGYTIAQLSDIHVGPTIGREFMVDMVARTNALGPDMICITGDLVDGSVAELGELVRPLAELRAKDGVFFVTGNHEYYSGADEWIAFLKTLGVRVLRNERVPIGGVDGFDLAGVDDWTAKDFGHGADLRRALEGRDPERAVILLAHQPKAIDEAELLGVDLQLSGHTHGGQLFPFNYLVKLQQPYIAGLHTQGKTQIYVSRGTGYWGPPMRVMAPAEITRIELRAG